jgi:hypothetical protein
MDAFHQLLDDFSACAQSNDGDRLAALFAPEGTYDDYFFGPHSGCASIKAMLARFHEGGENFHWSFFEPVCDGRTGYARYRFSYLSKVPESRGKTVRFEGMSRFLLRDGLIEHYAEVFDRGVAFVQLGFAPGKVARLLEKYAAGEPIGV